MDSLKKVFIPATVLVFGLISFMLPIVAYVGLIAVIAGLMKKRFSLVKRIFFSWTIVLSANILIYTISSVADVKVTFTSLGYIYTLLFLAVFFKYRKSITYTNVIDKDDIPGLLTALFTFTLLMIPFAATATLGPSDFVRLLSSGEDNASHYAILNYNSTNESYSYLSDRESSGLIQSLSIYQQGLHMNEAIVANFLRTGAVSDFTLLRLFYIFSVLFYALLSYWVVVIGLAAARRIKPTLHYLSWLSILPVITFFVSFNSSINLFSWGFQTQIASYVFLLALTWLCLNVRKNVLTALLISIQIILICHTWYLLLPIAGIIGLMALRYTLKDIFKRESWKLLSLYIVSVLVGIFPIVIGTVYSEKTNAINEQGGVHILSNGAIVASILVSLIFVYVMRNDHRIRKSIMIGMLMSILMVIFVYAYQSLTIGKLEYYFYKSLYTFTLFALISGVALSTMSVDALLRKFRSFRFVIAGFVLGLSFGFLYNLKPVQARVTINNWYNHAMEPSDAEAVFAVKANTKNSDLIYLGDCNKASDYLSNRWAGAILLTESLSRNQFETHYLLDTPDKQREYLSAHLDNDKKITARIDQKCIDEEVLRLLKTYETTVL